MSFICRLDNCSLVGMEEIVKVTCLKINRAKLFKKFFD